LLALRIATAESEGGDGKLYFGACPPIGRLDIIKGTFAGRSFVKSKSGLAFSLPKFETS
jgi:hypothetical protein